MSIGMGWKTGFSDNEYSDHTTEVKDVVAMNPEPNRATGQDIAVRVGSAIRVFRQIRSMTQGELAERVGMTQGAMSNIESGKRSQDVRLLEAVAEALDVSVEDILYMASLPPSDPIAALELVKKYLQKLTKQAR